MAHEWGTAPPDDNPAPWPVPSIDPLTPHRRPRVGPGNLVGRLLLASGLLAGAGVIGLGWWVLDGTFGNESDLRPDLHDDRQPSAPAAGKGSAQAASLLVCVTESRTFQTAIDAASIFEGTRLEASAYDGLTEPIGTYFAMSPDGTVTTVLPLPTGCPTPGPTSKP